MQHGGFGRLVAGSVPGFVAWIVSVIHSWNTTMPPWQALIGGVP